MRDPHPTPVDISINVNCITNGRYHDALAEGRDPVKELSDPHQINLLIVIDDDEEAPVKAMIARHHPDELQPIKDVSDLIASIYSVSGTPNGIHFAHSNNLPDHHQALVDNTLAELRDSIVSAVRSHNNF